MSDGGDAIAHDVALLLGKNGFHPQRADFCYCLYSVVTARDACRYVARRRRLEGPFAGFELLKEFVSLPFVVDRDVVGGVEFALGIVVEIDVNAIGDDSAGLGGKLKINERLERAATIRYRIEEERRGAQRALIFFAAKFQAAVEL